MSSWQKKAIALLLVILVAVGIFLGWTSYNYSNVSRTTTVEENTASARLWSNMLESRTGAVYEHIFELLVILYNKTELPLGTPPMDIHTRVAILDAMNDKLLISDEADAFFTYDVQSGQFFFSARQSLSRQVVIDLKEEVQRTVLERVKPFGDKSWDVYSVNGFDYLFKSVQLGKYIVGGLSACERYWMENHVNIMGEDPVCLLQVGDELFFMGGDPAAAQAAAGEEPWPESGSDRITVTGEVPFLGARAVISVRPPAMLRTAASFLLLLDSVVCVFLVLLLLFLLRQDVVRPSRELAEANRTLAAGQIDYRLDPEGAGSSEFRELYESFNSMADQIVKLRIDAYDMKLKDEQNQLTMLRAQIKPHSILNVINTINNMTYTSKPEEIRAYIGAFARFVRYMLNTSTTWTTVAEELAHISNYLNMQQMRFPDSIHYTVACEEAVSGRKIPFLVLFTLVENTTKHAMTLYEPLHITITCENYCEDGSSGTRLVVEDSGGGFSEEALEKLAEEGQSLYAKEHLGLSNVRYTLHLMYHREDLLRVGNRPQGGARVEVRIPEGEEDVP